jgi:hypothetical protein
MLATYKLVSTLEKNYQISKSLLVLLLKAIWYFQGLEDITINITLIPHLSDYYIQDITVGFFKESQNEDVFIWSFL